MNLMPDSHAGMSLPPYGQKSITKFVVEKSTFLKKSKYFLGKACKHVFFWPDLKPQV